MKIAAYSALLLTAWLAGTMSARPAARASPAGNGQDEILRRHGIDPTAKGVLNLLSRWHPDAAQRARIASAIKQLGSDSFEDRESASRQLVDWGGLSIVPLRAAADGDDPETASRAARLVLAWEQSAKHREDEELLASGSQWLCDSPAPQATPILLQLLPDLPDRFTREAVGQALWACTGPDDAPLIRKTLDGAPAEVRAVVIPALELATGDSTVEELKADLRDSNDQIRLAAARALMDRLPRPSIDTLVKLLASADPVVRGQSAWLLKQASGIPAEKDAGLDFSEVARRWKAWAAGADSNHPNPLGRRRLVVARYGQLISEAFALAAGNAELRATGYHQFTYEAEANGAARVKDGMLHLEGNHPDGDQRLFVDAQKLLGVPQFPRHLLIKAAIGGENDQPGAWHAGISVGNIRLLFHPGYADGSFRAERVDNKAFMIENQPMGFTPAAGVLYDLSIDARRDDAGDVKFDVCLADPAIPANRYTYTVSVKHKDVGDVTRVGLERSGRPGGAALFGPFTLCEAATDPAPGGPESQK